MPELPEVHTTATFLDKKVRGKTIKDLWTDWPKYFRAPKGEKNFKKMILSRKILSIGRIGKNILFRLSGGYVMLAHQKMTGHFLVGKWRRNETDKNTEEVWLGQKWVPAEGRGPLGDDRNRFIRLIFFLSGGEMLALSDLRRFAKLVLGKEKEIMELEEIRGLGPEPIDPKFTFEKFTELFKKKSGKIKQVLLDQTFLSGIGNIYADESLWRAKINPLRLAGSLTRKELRTLYKSIRMVLRMAIKLKGSSVDDYRDPSGRPGLYQKIHQVYHREGEACRRCGARIVRIKIGQRSAHFCPVCQKQK
ncbi:MAG: DNA-formamidopyrimidine glycosylase [Minisyncoccia bacterium]